MSVTMPRHLTYSSTAKALHWLIVVLLIVQFALGFIVPRAPRGTGPNTIMSLHISFGLVILALMTLRFAWRIAHPVAPESSLPWWQRLSSEAVHWLLYGMVFAVAITGWAWGSTRGYALKLFFTIPIPSLFEQGSEMGRAFARLHPRLIWFLIALAAFHVLAAMVHVFVYRDGVMRRMLPGKIT